MTDTSLFPAARRAFTQAILAKYSEDQPRDEDGRWTSGGGGGSDKPQQDVLPTSPTMGSIALPNRTMTSASEISEVAKAEAEKIGMGQYPLVVTAGTMRDYFGNDAVEEMLGPGSGYKTSGLFKPDTAQRVGGVGQYTKSTGKLYIFGGVLKGYTQGQIEATLRHEASHARYHYAYEKSARAATFILREKENLIREDGKTTYSKSYWERYQKDPTQGKLFLAVNESLAEMHAYWRPDSFAKLAPTYAKLDKLVMARWGRSKYISAPVAGGG